MTIKGRWLPPAGADGDRLTRAGRRRISGLWRGGRGLRRHDVSDQRHRHLAGAEPGRLERGGRRTPTTRPGPAHQAASTWRAAPRWRGDELHGQCEPSPPPTPASSPWRQEPAQPGPQVRRLYRGLGQERRRRVQRPHAPAPAYVAIAAGYSFGLGLHSDGSIFGLGRADNFGQVQCICPRTPATWR